MMQDVGLGKSGKFWATFKVKYVSLLGLSLVSCFGGLVACRSTPEEVQLTSGLCDVNPQAAPARPTILALNFQQTTQTLRISGSNLRNTRAKTTVTLRNSFVDDPRASLQWKLNPDEAANTDVLNVKIPDEVLADLVNNSSASYDVLVNNGCTTATMPLSLIALTYPTKGVPFKLATNGDGTVDLSYFATGSEDGRILQVKLHPYPDTSLGALDNIQKLDNQLIRLSYYDDALGHKSAVDLKAYQDKVPGTLSNITSNLDTGEVNLSYYDANSALQEVILRATEEGSVLGVSVDNGLTTLKYYSAAAPEKTSEVKFIDYNAHTPGVITNFAPTNYDNIVQISYYDPQGNLKTDKFKSLEEAYDPAQFTRLVSTKKFVGANIDRGGSIATNIYYKVLNGVATPAVSIDDINLPYFDYALECQRLGGKVCSLNQTKQIVWENLQNSQFEAVKIDDNSSSAKYVVDSDVCSIYSSITQSGNSSSNYFLIMLVDYGDINTPQNINVLGKVSCENLTTDKINVLCCL